MVLEMLSKTNSVSKTQHKFKAKIQMKGVPNIKISNSTRLVMNLILNLNLMISETYSWKYAQICDDRLLANKFKHRKVEGKTNYATLHLKTTKSTQQHNEVHRT